MDNRIREAFGQIHATEQMKSMAYSQVLWQMKHGRKPRPFYRPMAAAFVVLFLCISMAGWRLWHTPVSYLSVDINPSIELVLNRFDYVMHAEGRNEDGKALLSELKLNGKSYIDAVELIVESELFKPYLTDNASLTFTVASPKADAILSGLENSAAAQYHSACMESDVQTAHEAHHCGVSLGRYQIYLYLSAYDPSITLEECENMSMQQLNDLLAKYESSGAVLPDTNFEYETSGGYHERHHGGHHY